MGFPAVTPLPTTAIFLDFNQLIKFDCEQAFSRIFKTALAIGGENFEFG